MCYNSDMGKISNSISLTKSSFRVLRQDKELVGINFFGGLGVIVLWILGALSIWLLGGIEFIDTAAGSDVQLNALGYIGFLLLLLGTTFARHFIEAMIAAAVLFRFRGGDPTVSTAFAAARGRAWPIMMFSMVSVTIGLILSAIEERLGVVGTIIANVLNIAWAIASAFAIINIVDAPEPIGPFKAVKRSGGVIKKTWGENVILNLGLGIAFFLGFLAYSIPSVLLTVAAASVSGTLAFIVGALLIIGLLVLLIATSVLGAIVKAAVYFYAIEGTTPAQFDADLIANAIKPKKKLTDKVFG